MPGQLVLIWPQKLVVRAEGAVMWRNVPVECWASQLLQAKACESQCWNDGSTHGWPAGACPRPHRRIASLRGPSAHGSRYTSARRLLFPPSGDRAAQRLPAGQPAPRRPRRCCGLQALQRTCLSSAESDGVSQELTKPPLLAPARGREAPPMLPDGQPAGQPVAASSCRSGRRPSTSGGGRKS